MQYLSGNTRTGFALQFTKNLINNEERGNARKVRHNDCNICIQRDTYNVFRSTLVLYQSILIMCRSILVTTDQI